MLHRTINSRVFTPTAWLTTGATCAYSKRRGERRGFSMVATELSDAAMHGCCSCSKITPLRSTPHSHSLQKHFRSSGNSSEAAVFTERQRTPVAGRTKLSLTIVLVCTKRRLVRVVRRVTSFQHKLGAESFDLRVAIVAFRQRRRTKPGTSTPPPPRPVSVLNPCPRRKVRGGERAAA